MSFGSRVPYMSRVSPPSPARKAWATPVPAGRATTDPRLTGWSVVPASSQSSRSPSPSRTAKISSSAEWQCGAVCSLPGSTSEIRIPVRCEPAWRPRSRTRRPTVAASRSTELDIVRADDVLRSRLGLDELRRAGRGLALPGVILLRADRRPGLGEPGDARAREPRRTSGVDSLPERKHVQTVVAGEKRVCVL